MKRILYTTTAVVFALMFFSCRNANPIGAEVLPVSSTSELAAFREWQAQKLVKENAEPAKRKAGARLPKVR